MTTSPDVLIHGGTVVTDGWSGPATVAVEAGRVTAVLSPDAGGELRAERTIDATGRLVLPGGVDAHCHVGLPLGAYTTRDTFESASVAALAGGTTTIVDFAIPAPGQDPLDVLRERLAAAATSRCDYAMHGCVNSGAGSVADTVHALAAAGVRTVKLFTTYRDLLMVDVGTIERVMAALTEVSGLTYVHAEANDLVESAQREAVEAGRIDAAGHADTRPAAAEDRAVADVLAAAERVGAPVYFVHQSTPGAVDLVVAARQRGVRAFTESCPHYLTLDSTSYTGEHPERWVCCPPLRDRRTVEELDRRLEAGFVDTVGSDHCCYDSVQKAERADDVRAMPNGLPGVETRLPVVFDRFVATGRISPERFVALTAANPARLNGLYPRKGTIAPGSDADLVVLDPRETRRLTAAALHMETDYSPYEGRSVTGWPVTVLSRGRVVVEDGQVLDPGPVGEFLPAGPIRVAGSQ
jgi:dihydropyrimidinase